MAITFEDIEKKIKRHNPADLILSCYHVLDNHKEKTLPIWSVFLLIKWSYLYSTEKDNYEALSNEAFLDILNSITNFNQEHIGKFFKNGQIEKGFHILYHQQFYLQRSVYNQIFEAQLKLYHTIRGKHDVNASFERKTGLSILDFLKILKTVWLYINIDNLSSEYLKYNGYLDNNFIIVLGHVFGEAKVIKFLQQLVLNPIDPVKSISSFKRGIGREDLQSMETTFFVMFPFQIVQGHIKLIHESIFKYVTNYYIYDYLKSEDDKFTTDFGYRVEKYVELGLNEIGEKYETETALKKRLPSGSKVVDFFIPDQNIFIECKATELQPYPSVNPTDDLLVSSLKSSLLKAYFEQLIHVAKTLNPTNENWGIIITYKEMFWSRFSELYELGKDVYPSANESDFIPCNNVFIIDVYTWDKIMQIVKDKKAALIDILKLARTNNSNPKTSKQTFNMHLDVYDLELIELDYLMKEHEMLDLKVESED